LTEENILRIGLNLKGKVREMFEELKKLKGIESNNDVLRYLIADFYNREVKK